MNEQRRNLVQAIVKGGGAVSLATVPAVWTKPVIESTILPAHAQTTSCADVLLLNQLAVGCGDSTIDEISQLFVDESAPCPVLARYPDSAGVEGLLTAVVRFPGQFYELVVSLGRLAEDGSLDDSVGYEAHILSDENCPDLDPVQNTTDNIPFEILGSAGGRYRVTAVASTDLSTSTASISNIQITRIG